MFIDPGLRNMAWLIRGCNDDDHIVCWKVASIVAPNVNVKRMSTYQVFECVREWIDSLEMSVWWEYVDEIWVELQMTSKYKAIVTMLYARFPDKVKLLAPAKFRYHTSGNWGSHAKNKVEDIKYVEARYTWPEDCDTKQKKDDLATVFLMHEYVYRDHVEKQ